VIEKDSHLFTLFYCSKSGFRCFLTGDQRNICSFGKTVITDTTYQSHPSSCFY